MKPTQDFAIFKPGIVLIAILCCATIFVIYAQKGSKTGWKPCTGLPPIQQTGFTEGTLKVLPDNAPCYIDIRATATDSNGHVQTSEPVRIYIKK